LTGSTPKIVFTLFPPALVLLGIGAVLGLTAVTAQDTKSEKPRPEKVKDAQTQIDEWVTKLGSDKAKDREKAEVELSKMGDKAILSLKRAYWGRTKDLKKTIDEMIGALGSADWNIRRRATLVLADIGIPALGALQKAKKSDDIEVQYRVRILVRRIQQDNDKELSQQARKREAITRILGGRGGSGCLPILGDALAHGDRATKRVAAKALSRLPEKTDEMIALLERAVLDNDMWVSAYGAHGMGQYGSKAAMAKLISAFKSIRRPARSKIKVTPPKKKSTNKKTKNPMSLIPKEKIAMKNGYPIGAMPPASSMFGGKSSSAHGFRRSRIIRNLGLYARAGQVDAGKAVLAGFEDPTWLVRLESLSALSPILVAGGAKRGELRYPATKAEGRILIKVWAKRIDSLVASYAKADQAKVASPKTKEQLQAFIASLYNAEGQLLGKAAIRKKVQEQPFVAGRSLGILGELIKDNNKRAKLKGILAETMSRHKVSMRHGKDKKTYIVQLDFDGSLIVAGKNGRERLDPNNILRILWSEKPSFDINPKKQDNNAEAVEEMSETDQVLLGSGERLTGKLKKLDQKNAYLQWTSGENIIIPTKMIAAVSLKSKLSTMASDPRSGPGEIVTKNGSRLIGKVLEVTDKKVMFDLDGQSLPLNRSEIVEVRLQNSSSSQQELDDQGHFARVHLKGGDRLWGLLLAIQPDRIQLGSQTLGQVWVDRSRLADVQFSTSLGFDSDVTVIANYSANKVIYVDLKGKIIKSIPIPESPWDIERLQHGHLLVALYRRGSVIELDENGKEIWRVSGFSQPSDVDRLPNGHTLICDRGRGKIIELDYNRNVVFQYSGVYASDAERLANGHTLIADSNRGRLIEIDAFGNVVWELSGYRNPQDVDILENGHLLIVERHSRVIEIDRSGRIYWEKNNLRSPTDADRLENGNTLITESSGNRVIEVSPDGTIVQEIAGLNYPSQAQRR
jgi:hypothetical protein